MPTCRRLFSLLTVVVSFFFLFQPDPSPAAGSGQPVTVTLPASAILQTIRGMLPLPLEQIKSSQKFQGTITIDSISKLTIQNHLISVQGQVSGRDMQVTTNIGGQNIQLKLGKLVLPVTCDIALRFDAGTRTLFLTPKFQNPVHGKSNSAKTLLPMLNGLSREYPLKLDQLSPMAGKFGNKIISLRLNPVDIQAGNNEMILTFHPSAHSR